MMVIPILIHFCKAITVHTMIVLVLKWRTPPRAALLGSAIIWLIVGLMVGIPNAVVDSFYGPTGHCAFMLRRGISIRTAK